MYVFSKHKRVMATLSSEGVCHTTSSWCHSSSLLLCFSFHHCCHHVMVVIILLILKNVHGPISLALFIAPVTIVLHNSMVSFMCFHVFFSSPNQLVLLNSMEYGRAHWKPITPLQLLRHNVLICPKIICVSGCCPFHFPPVKSSSSPFHAPVSQQVNVVFLSSLLA